MTSPVRVGLIGVGGMARYHIRQLLKMQSTTRIVALCEPSEAMALEAAKVFVEVGVGQRRIRRFCRDHAAPDVGPKSGPRRPNKDQERH